METAWDVDVVLARGLPVRVRQISPADAEALVDFHERLSPESRFKRFFTAMPHLPDAMVHRFVNVDHMDREALVVEAGDRLIAVGRYERLATHPTDAEVAFSTADEYQGQGIGTLLLEHLATLAASRGIERFVAETLASNDAMLRVFSRAGYQVHRRFSDGIYEIEFAIQPTTDSDRLRAEREHRATVASIGRLLRPSSIAIEPSPLRSRIIAKGFTGRVLTVGEVSGGGDRIPADAGIDLVVIDAPAADVPDAGWRWAGTGTGALFVASGGRDDPDSAGPLVVRRLVRTARRHGLRVLGPSAVGVVNTDPALSLYALVADVPVRPGRIAVFADHRSTAITLLAELHRRGLGVSTFVGAGDKADISANDLLEYWEQDPATDVILLAFGTFGNPRRFARLAPRVSRSKPIVVVTPPSPLVDALCRRTGVMRADSLADLADYGRLLAYHARWAADPAALVDPPEPFDPEAIDRVVSAVFLDHADGAELPSDDLAALLDAAGIGQAEPPADWMPIVSIRSYRDELFGGVVEVTTEPGAPPRVALAPLTSPDLHALSFGYEALGPTLVSAATALDCCAELSELDLTVSAADPSRTISARAAVAPPTGLLRQVRRLN